MEIKTFNNKNYISLTSLISLGFEMPKRGTQILKVDIFNQFLSIPPDTESIRYYGLGKWNTQSSVSPFASEIGLKSVDNDRLFIELCPKNFKQIWESN